MNFLIVYPSTFIIEQFMNCYLEYLAEHSSR